MISLSGRSTSSDSPPPNMQSQKYETIEGLAENLYREVGIDFKDPANNLKPDYIEIRCKYAQKFPELRKQAFELYKAAEALGEKEQAIDVLIALLVCDPIEEASALNLLSFIQDMAIQLDDNLIVRLRLKLSQFFCALLDSFLLHHIKGHYGVIKEETRLNLQQQLDRLKGLQSSGSNDSHVEFLLKYALETTKYFMTDAWRKEAVLEVVAGFITTVAESGFILQNGGVEVLKSSKKFFILKKVEKRLQVQGCI